MYSFTSGQIFVFVALKMYRIARNTHFVLPYHETQLAEAQCSILGTTSRSHLASPPRRFYLPRTVSTRLVESTNPSPVLPGSNALLYWIAVEPSTKCSLPQLYEAQKVSPTPKTTVGTEQPYAMQPICDMSSVKIVSKRS